MFANFPALQLVAFAASATPGPNNLMLMQSGATFGMRRTLPHIWGIDVGFGLLILAIGGGLAGVVASAPMVLLALKWAGAAFLLVLAYRIARSAPPPGERGREDEGTDARDGAPTKLATAEGTSAEGKLAEGPTARPLSFLGAVAFQWVNPKAWLGALAGIVTFTVPDAYGPSAVVVALTMMIVNLPCAALWTGMGTLLQRWLRNPLRRTAFNYAMAAMLVASLYPMLR